MKKAVLKFLVALCMISCVTACSRQDENAYNAGENKAPTDVSEYVSSNQSETPPDQTFSDDINTDILSRHLLPPFERMEKADLFFRGICSRRLKEWKKRIALNL